MTCKHGIEMSIDQDWDDKEEESYEACDCCGMPMHMDAYGAEFEGDPNASRLLCMGCQGRKELGL